MKGIVTSIDCTRVNGDERESRRETVATESNMQLLVNGEVSTNFLYSRGLDEQLVVGHLVSSGIIQDLSDIEKLEIGDGKAEIWIEQRSEHKKEIQDIGLSISHRQLLDVRTKLLNNQKHHKATRGFHGAIILELSTGRWFMCEDIGRHNAVDKVIGHGIQNGFNCSQSMVLLSGRLVSDIVIKCVNSRIPLIASMTVATDGGIKLAVESNFTIIGSLSEDGFWLYNEGVVKVT